MKSAKVLAVIVTALLFVVGESRAQNLPNGYAVPNWSAQARQNLLNGATGAPATDADFAARPGNLRCIKLNNYWCLKDIGWRGGIGRDGAGHTAFSEAAWSARAVARDLRSKYRRGPSAIQIAAAYAPWTDTRGSRPYRPGEARCVRPSVPEPNESHCLAHCNCPPDYANHMIRGMLGQTIYDDLELFDRNGRATDALPLLMRNMSNHETGWAVATDAVMREGITREAQ